MDKNEFKNFVQETTNKKLKNPICPYCGSDNRVYIGDGSKIDIIDAGKKKIFEDIIVTIACANCGYVSSFLPKFFFGEESEKFMNFFVESFGKNETEEKEGE